MAFDFLIYTIQDIYLIIGAAILVGFLTGLERLHEKRKMAGIRAFILVSVINALAAYITNLFDTLLIVIVSLAGTIVFSLFLIISKNFKHNFVTSLAIILMGFIGAIIGFGYLKFGLALGVLLPLILILKDKFHDLEKWESKQRVLGILQLGVLALILLPLVPNEPIDPWGIVNLNSLLILIIAISLLEFLTYIIIKKWKEKGLMTSGALIGIIDSDVINGAMANIVKKFPKFSKTAALAVVAGNLSMLVRNLVIVGSLSLAALYLLLPPILTMLFFGIFLIAWNLKKNPKIKDYKLDVENPLSFKTAIRFAFFTVVISAVALIAQLLIGDTGLYLAAFLGALVGDAPVTAAAIILGLEGNITFSQVAIMVMINSFVSSLNDGLLQYLAGAKQLAKDFFKIAIPIVIAGIIVLVIGLIVLG